MCDLLQPPAAIFNAGRYGGGWGSAVAGDCGWSTAPLPGFTQGIAPWLSAPEQLFPAWGRKRIPDNDNSNKVNSSGDDDDESNDNNRNRNSNCNSKNNHNDDNNNSDKK